LYQHPETVDAALGLIAMVANAHWIDGNDRMQNAAYQCYLAIGEEQSVRAVAIDPRSGVMDPQRYNGTSLGSAFTATINESATLLKEAMATDKLRDSEHDAAVDLHMTDSHAVIRVTEELESLFISQTIHDAIISLFEQDIIDRKQAEGLLVLLDEVDVSKLDKAAVLSARATARRNLRSMIDKAKNVSAPLLDKIVGDANNGIAPKEMNEVVGAEVIKRGAMNKDVEKIVRGTLANELTRLFRESSDIF
jgi:hypothetical protein